MNGSTPLRLAQVFGATAIFAVAAVGVTQPPLPNDSDAGKRAAQNQVLESGFSQPGPSQLSSSDVAIAATAQIAAPSSPSETSSRPAPSPRPAAGDTPLKRAGAAGDVIGFSHYDASGTQTITLVHAGKSWMAVYHIDRSGTIRLVSSRPIDADFSLQLNATSPLPEEIREIGRR